MEDLRLGRRAWISVMEPTVWHSGMMGDYQIGNKPGVAAKWFGQEWEPPTHIPPPRSMDTIEELFRYVRGEPQPREVFPEALFVFDQKRFKKMGDLFAAGGFYVVHGKLAEVLSRFDLGQGRLIPFPIYQADKVTPIAGAFHIWEFGARESAFLPGQSPKIRPDGIGLNVVEGRWKVGSDVEDGDVALSAAAASGPPDVWCDPKLRSSLFFSDAFVTALHTAKTEIDYFHLRRCKLL